MRDFRRLAVWRKAHEVALGVYRASKGFPGEERYGLTAHLRKSATSVPSNIAEGCGRDGIRELSRFLTIATGSASELEYQLLLARDLGYLSRAEHSELSEQNTKVRRMLYRLKQSLRRHRLSKPNRESLTPRPTADNR